MSAKRASATPSLRRHIAIGFAVVALLLGGVGGWAAVASISGSVIASGTLVVETNTKRVQHRDGGIVSEILVKDGDYVLANDLLLRLDDTLVRSNLAIVVKQIDEMMASRARLEAERDGEDEVQFPTELTDRAQEPDMAKALRGEKTLFAARKASQISQREQLGARVVQIGEEIQGLKAQRDAKELEIGFINQELSGLIDLNTKGLVPITRIMSMRREAARLEGERGQMIAEIARAKGRILETELQLTQLDQTLLSDVVRELRDIQVRMVEFAERRVAAKDQLTRVEIRAPRSGYVLQSVVHTIGGVIAPAETVMLIVPKDDRLIVEARVQPNDIDQVNLGQKAVLRFSAFNQRSTPELNGRVDKISADLARDQTTGLPYYVIRIRLEEIEIQRLGDQNLLPGMPVETFIQTGERSALSYFVKPLQDQITRAFREE